MLVSSSSPARHRHQPCLKLISIGTQNHLLDLRVDPSWSYANVPGRCRGMSHQHPLNIQLNGEIYQVEVDLQETPKAETFAAHNWRAQSQVICCSTAPLTGLRFVLARIHQHDQSSSGLLSLTPPSLKTFTIAVNPLPVSS
ncbi:hypothetical protein PtB15_15B59 [Puccinia triticina]|nr:hypothetical protein PtB15_15B59 [Puccinia triticina]